MRLEQFRENPDGSADFSIEDLTPEEANAFIRLGIIKALEDGIKEAKEKFTPTEDFNDEDNTTVGGTD